MIKFVVLFLTSLMLVQLVTSLEADPNSKHRALNCYTCDNTTCREDQSKWIANDGCGQSCFDTQDCVPQCMVVRYYIGNDNSTLAIARDCLVDNKVNNTLLDKCQRSSIFAVMKNVKIVSCNICNKDLCNSSLTLAVGVYSLAIALFGYLLC